jgi:hypothetical protein
VETVIIAGAVALAAVFVALRILRTFRSKSPSCCSGSDKPVKKASFQRYAGK